MKRFVLTGGHGVGKSSMIAALELSGEHVVHEAASTVRTALRADGIAFPEDELDFESKALALHLQRERRVLGDVERVFMDRGAADHLAYARVGHWQVGQVETDLCLKTQYDMAFLLDPPPGGAPTLFRVEEEFCRRLAVAIEEVYTEMGVPVIQVPFRPLAERIEHVLDTVEKT